MSESWRIGSRVGNARQVMPPGYSLWWVEPHYIWIEDSTERESVVHWNRWVIRRWAWFDFRKKDGEG